MNPQEVFATAIWNHIPSDENIWWVARVAEQSIVKQPMGDYGAIIQDMLDKGVSAESIARFAKIVGYETAFGICYALEGPSSEFENVDPTDEINWKLFQTNPETDEIIKPLSGSHELLLSMDPRGNEMEPSAEAFSALNKSHHDTVVLGNTRLRRQWLCEYLNTSDVEVFDFQPQVVPFQKDPKWPGRRVGFLLGFTETDVWIMSNGLSNPEHPADNVDWHRVVPLPAPEVLSRIPKGSINRSAKITEHVKNKHIQIFLNIACTALSLHLNEELRRVTHKAAYVKEYLIDVKTPALTGALTHFSDAESLGIADPIPLSDHNYLRVPVHFATFVEESEMNTIEADALGYSKVLKNNGQLGFITNTG